ncbi:MAG: SDR family oxidoreductase [Flavobacteriaceae bacterium]
MILVTGGTGLVGSHLLCHLVQQNEPIRAVYRTSKSLEKVKNVFASYPSSEDNLFSKIEWIQADITDVPSMILAFENITQVYHCAALISFDPNDYLQMRKVNIHGTAIVANLAIDAGVKKLCYVSSIAAVGEDPKKEVTDEENDWVGNDKSHGYAITKYGAEMEIWRASQEGVDVVVVNPGVILGSGFWDSGSGKLFSQIDEGFGYYSKGVTGFIGVEDVVKVMIQLMDSSIKNERFILVSENKSFQEILFLIADCLNKKRPSKLVKKWQTNLFWRWEWFLSKTISKKARMSKHSAKSLYSKTYYSSKKIEQALNFSFENIDPVIKRVCEEFISSQAFLN